MLKYISVNLAKNKTRSVCSKIVKAFAFAIVPHIHLFLQEPKVNTHNAQMNFFSFATYLYLDETFPKFLTQKKNQYKNAKSASSVKFWHSLADMLPAGYPQPL